MTTNNAVDVGLSGATGTGNFVGATSPTLVTPNLGTPSAINLSNATALAASALPSGTLFNLQQAQLTTPFTTTSTTMTALTGVSVSITPTSASNKVLVRAVVQADVTGTNLAYFQLYNGSAAIGVGTSVGSRFACGASMYSTLSTQLQTIVMEWLDSPATTSPVTYSVQGAVSSGTLSINATVTDTNSGAFARAVSVITVSEVHA